MRSVAVVIAIAAAFLAVEVTGAALAAADPPHRFPGGVLLDHMCKKSRLAELRCVSSWYKFDSTPPGRRTVATTVHYRWVLEYARPVSAGHRQRYASAVRASIAAQARKQPRRVIQPLRVRWADGWRVLIADITWATD